MPGKRKVLVSGYDQKFWYSTQHALESTEKYEFKEDLWLGHDSHDLDKSEKFLNWADIIICEWALGNAVFYSQRKLPHQKLIVRFHGQERNTDYPNHINYENVDEIIFVSKHLLYECSQLFNIPTESTIVLPNNLNTRKFNLSKHGGSEFTIGIIGISPALKRIDLVYETLIRLIQIDKRYQLRIKGASPASYEWLWARTKERKYYEKIFRDINSSELRYKIIFDPAGDDVEHWLQYIGYILSPSDFESFHMAPAEGMASGSIPIIWKRDGSSDIFPSVIKTDSPELAAKQIDFFRRCNAGQYYKIISQNFIASNFDTQVIAGKWECLLDINIDITNNIEEENKLKKVIVFFSIGNWETFHRKEMIEALSIHLKEEFTLLIIEQGNHFQTILKNKSATKSELKKYLNLEPIRVGNNIYKIKIINSGFNKDTIASKILKKNSNYAKAIYASLLEMFGHDSKILYWIQKPLQYKWINQKCDFIYEIYDEYTMDFETGDLNKKVLNEENYVLPLAKHVFFTSQPLADRKSHLTNSFTVIENGVNFNVFSKYRIEHVSQSSKRASVGYLGNLSNFFNWELMCQVVEKMPEIDFIFYGQIEIGNMQERKIYAEKLMGYKNTLFTGRVTREEGAVGINLVDVLIIPFVINDAMHAVNPLKLWEYFVTGKPVVITPMDAITIKEPLIKIASKPEEWVEKILTSINEFDNQFSNLRIQMAKQRSWNILTAKYANVVIPYARIDVASN